MTDMRKAEAEKVEYKDLSIELEIMRFNVFLFYCNDHELKSAPFPSFSGLIMFNP